MYEEGGDPIVSEIFVAREQVMGTWMGVVKNSMHIPIELIWLGIFEKHSVGSWLDEKRFSRVEIRGGNPVGRTDWQDPFFIRGE